MTLTVKVYWSLFLCYSEVIFITESVLFCSRMIVSLIFCFTASYHQTISCVCISMEFAIVKCTSNDSCSRVCNFMFE